MIEITCAILAVVVSQFISLFFIIIYIYKEPASDNKLYSAHIVDNNLFILAIHLKSLEEHLDKHKINNKDE